jgi:hypothetical protein
MCDSWTDRMIFLLFIGLLATAVSGDAVNAAEAPKSLEKLRQADLVIIGTIEKVIAESERSRVEQGFGNYDWGIYLTLTVEKVEQGNYFQPEIECRCFRIKSRRSAVEYVSVSGHAPIPGSGTRVRVYLHRDGTDWIVISPNGITPPDADTDEEVWRTGRLGDAPEVVGLSGLMYTYVLPLEFWVLFFFVLLPLAYCGFLLVRYLRRTQSGVEVNKSSS